MGRGIADIHNDKRLGRLKEEKRGKGKFHKVVGKKAQQSNFLNDINILPEGFFEERNSKRLMLSTF